VDRIRESLVPLEFPLVVGEETEDEAVKSYRKRMRTYNKRMETLLERKAGFNNDLQSNIYANEKLDMTNEKIDGINTHLTRISARHQQLKVLLKDVPEDLQTQVEHMDLAIQFIELKDEFTKLKTQFKQIRKDEAHERETQKALLEHALWRTSGDGSEKNQETTMDELKSYQVQLRLWEQYQRACGELRTLSTELQGSCDSPDHTSKEEMVVYYTEIIESAAEEKAALYRQKEQLVVAAEKLALEKEIIYCPECETPLRWRDNALVSVHDHQPVEERNYTTEIKKVEKQLREINKTKAKHEQTLERIRAVVFPVIQKNDPQFYKQMKSQVKMLTTYVTQNKQREEELARIERESGEDYLTPALKGLHQQLDEKEHEMEELLEAITAVPTEDLPTLRDQLQKLNSQVEHYQAHTEEMVQISAELKELRQKHKHLSIQIQTLKQQVAGVNIKAIQKKITNINRNIAKAKKTQAKDEELSSKVDQYLFYREQQKELYRWEEQLAEITKQTKSAERIHTANLTLKDKYVQAEIVALESTIMSINEHTRYYLDTFFADHQLSAKLESVHKGKKIQTLKINTAINYKGNEYDNIDQLSGGEFDRCTLASICGINSMLGSPIMVLDESLASLDTDTNTEIIRFLSELAEDKLILVCSHEAVRGIFDDVLEL
jgi:DNA repair exonuclease SbcCD ATPase subunit